jgi:hypothetical protein
MYTDIDLGHVTLLEKPCGATGPFYVVESIDGKRRTVSMLGGVCAEAAPIGSPFTLVQRNHAQYSIYVLTHM